MALRLLPAARWLRTWDRPLPERTGSFGSISIRNAHDGSELRYTLVADGPGDRALLPILTWLLRELSDVGDWALVPQFFDPRPLDDPPSDLAGKIVRALQLFPCDVLFVHRDAETCARSDRVREIEVAIPISAAPHVCVVPVRMTEAWLLIDARAIRTAAGNPNGTRPLAMPSLATIESIPDPKQMLRTLLLEATALRGRRRTKFEREVSQRVHRVAELIDDFRSLRGLPAFREFEREARSTVLSWASRSQRG